MQSGSCMPLQTLQHYRPRSRVAEKGLRLYRKQNSRTLSRYQRSRRIQDPLQNQGKAFNTWPTWRSNNNHAFYWRSDGGYILKWPKREVGGLWKDCYIKALAEKLVWFCVLQLKTRRRTSHVVFVRKPIRRGNLAEDLVGEESTSGRSSCQTNGLSESWLAKGCSNQKKRRIG